MLTILLNKNRVLWLFSLFAIASSAISQPNVSSPDSPEQLAGTISSNQYISNNNYISANNDFIITIPYGSDLEEYPQMQIQENYLGPTTYVRFAISPENSYQLEVIPKEIFSNTEGFEFNKEIIAVLNQLYLNKYFPPAYNANTAEVKQSESINVVSLMGDIDGFYSQIILHIDATTTTYIDSFLLSYNNSYVNFVTQQTYDNDNNLLNEHLQEQYNDLLQFVINFRVPGTINNNQYISANNDFTITIPYTTNLADYPQMQIHENYSGPPYVRFDISSENSYTLTVVPKEIFDNTEGFKFSSENIYYSPEGMLHYFKETAGDYYLSPPSFAELTGEYKTICCGLSAYFYTINGYDGFYFQSTMQDNDDLTPYYSDLFYLSYNNVYVAFGIVQTLDNNDASLNEQLAERENNMLQFIEGFRELPQE